MALPQQNPLPSSKKSSQSASQAPYSAARPNPAGVSPVAPHKAFLPDNQPFAHSAPDLGTHLAQNSNVRGAYGNWGQAPVQPFAQNTMPTNGYPPYGGQPINSAVQNQAQFQQNPAYTQPMRPQAPTQTGPNIAYSGRAVAQQFRNDQTPMMPQSNGYPQQTMSSNQAPQSQRFDPRQPRPVRANQNVGQGVMPPQNPGYQNPQGNPAIQQRPVQNPQQGQAQVSVQQPVQAKKGFFSQLFAAPTPQKPLDKNSKAYLSQLNPNDLRKEVVQTEIEIQKTLIDSERSYRQGVSTIRDLIAPSSIKISTGYIELGTKLVRTFFVLVYPRTINSGWLEGLVNADIPMDLSIFIYPRDSTEVLKELKGKVGKIQASLQLNAERGAARDPQLETAYRDVEGLRDAIQQGVEKFFRVGVYITIYASNNDELEKISQSVEGLLAQQNILMKRAALQMDDGFNSSLPILKDDLSIYSNMNTSPLSASFPFVSSELSSNDGILYGINRHNTSLIIFDRFELENANSVVFATSGAGKSFTVKLEILRSLMLGINVIVIDPEQEYKILSDTLGGAYVNMSLNSSNRINPFDLPKPLAGESTADILRSAIIDLMGLMNLMLGKLNPSEESIMERAIQEAYAKRDITPDSDLINVDIPTMSDLVEILNGIVGGESLSQRLYRYTEGTFAGIFNQRTNININNDFIVFNIRDLQEQLRPIAMYVLLKYIWNEIRSELKKRILAIDEAWIMMQYEDSARFLFGLAKRARKYYLGVTTITQDVGDFLNSPFGKPIVTNAAMKILLKQSTAAIDLVADTFALTAGEKQVLLQSEVGQGIFFAGPRHVAIEVIAFPTESRIITTNPKDLVKMQGFENAETDE